MKAVTFSGASLPIKTPCHGCDLYRSPIKRPIGSDNLSAIIILLVFCLYKPLSSGNVFTKKRISPIEIRKKNYLCLLYTSDAADEEDSVDLGGRRIIKKKKKK